MNIPSFKSVHECAKIRVPVIQIQEVAGTVALLYQILDSRFLLVLRRLFQPFEIPFRHLSELEKPSNFSKLYKVMSLLCSDNDLVP